MSLKIADYLLAVQLRVYISCYCYLCDEFAKNVILAKNRKFVHSLVKFPRQFPHAIFLQQSVHILSAFVIV